MPCKNLVRHNRVNVKNHIIAPNITVNGTSASFVVCAVENVEDCPKKKNPGDVTPHCWRY